MKLTRRTALFAAPLALLAACSGGPTRRYTGPEVTRITVYKDARKMYLWHGNLALKEYDIELGFAPSGDKQVEGDGRTPEGHYWIDRRNPNSRFHLSIGISYPNEWDVAEAAQLGQSAGGDIFIHGQPSNGIRSLVPDWTWGCIAVSNEEIEEIYVMVRLGTPISIYA